MKVFSPKSPSLILITSCVSGFSLENYLRFTENCQDEKYFTKNMFLLFRTKYTNQLKSYPDKFSFSDFHSSSRINVRLSKSDIFETNKMSRFRSNFNCFCLTFCYFEEIRFNFNELAVFL